MHGPPEQPHSWVHGQQHWVLWQLSVSDYLFKQPVWRHNHKRIFWCIRFMISEKWMFVCMLSRYTTIYRHKSHVRISSRHATIYRHVSHAGVNLSSCFCRYHHVFFLPEKASRWPERLSHAHQNSHVQDYHGSHLSWYPSRPLSSVIVMASSTCDGFSACTCT